MHITEFVKDKANQAVFSHYRAGNLYYQVMRSGTRERYEFPIEAEDLQGATINARESALTLMRYIRIALENNTLIHINTFPEPWVCGQCFTKQTIFNPVDIGGVKICPICSASEIFDACAKEPSVFA